MISDKKLGLIAGNGKFPIVFAQKARAKGYHVIAGGVQGDTSFFLRFFVDKYQAFHVGALLKLFEYFKAHQIQDVIMAGQVNPDNLFEADIEFDDAFKNILQALKNRKADTIFAAIADKLKEYGMSLLDSTFLIKEYLAPQGAMTKRGPSLVELEDIAFGRQIAKQMGGIDIGQTVVVKEKAIVAIEAMEGTDRTIRRGGKIARRGAVVVKMSKPNQDFRFDVPVIGPRTIKNMIASQSGCIAIEAGKTIMIDKEICLKLANKAGVCIVGTP
ncbi:MAG: UDP-2,3-diacylglucosamine diphosphatase LpxI [Candidatus Omnitrophica bacterium]|nr:UDP-2,3-diacylglucosamine diphosphatase LpxI [Candidatus Omnitrophota bacterium]